MNKTGIISSYHWLIVTVVYLLLNACDSSSMTSNQKTVDSKQDDIIASILAYNHTDDYIHKLYIDGAMGPNIQAHGGGASITCCATLPQPWHKELRVNIEWTTSPNDKTLWHKKSVLLPEYDSEGGMFQVHFLPDLDVVIIVSDLHGTHPDYPGPKLK